MTLEDTFTSSNANSYKHLLLLKLMHLTQVAIREFAEEIEEHHKPGLIAAVTIAQILHDSVSMRHKTYGRPMVENSNRYFELMRRMGMISEKEGTRILHGHVSSGETDGPRYSFISEKAIEAHCDLAYSGHYGFVQ